MLGAPFRSACNNHYYFSCKIEVRRIDIPATRLARGNHVGGLSFFFGVGGSGRRPVESADPEGSRRAGPCVGGRWLSSRGWQKGFTTSIRAGGWGRQSGPRRPRRGLTFADRHQVFSPGAPSGACRGPGGVPEGFSRSFGVVRELILGSISSLCREFGSSFGLLFGKFDALGGVWGVTSFTLLRNAVP